MSKYGWLQYLLPSADPDDEHIDKFSEQSIRLDKKRYERHNNKDFMSDVHIKLKFGEDSDKNTLWSAIIFEVDNDFPWNPLRKSDATGKFCTKCGGYLWRNVILEPQDLKKACRQIGIVAKSVDDIRIQSFMTAYKCGGSLVDKVITETQEA